MLAALPREITQIIVGHDMDVVFALAHSITVLHLGEVIADGDRDAVIRDPRVREVYLGE
jgi:ABC-type branched-subunit amino acid transport system ATPase component